MSSAHPDTWTWKLDATGDIDLTEQHQVPLVYGDDAILQDVKVAMTSFKGEDELDPEFGFDLFGAIPNEARLKAELRRVLEYDDFRHARIESVASLEIFPHRGRRERVFIRARVRLARPAAQEPTTETVEFSVRSPSQ